MKILRPGHIYEVANYEKPEAPGQIIRFIEQRDRQEDGTVNEELVRVLLDRVTRCQEQVPAYENHFIRAHLEEALMWMEHRIADRKSRGVWGTHAP